MSGAEYSPSKGWPAETPRQGLYKGNSPSFCMIDPALYY
jgi:hypothetical protein